MLIVYPGPFFDIPGKIQADKKDAYKEGLSFYLYYE